MSCILLSDSLTPVGISDTSLPGVKLNFVRIRRRRKSVPAPMRLLPTILPFSSEADLIEGTAMSWYGNVPLVETVTIGAPRATAPTTPELESVVK
jgi:hypothetical protein